MNDTEYMKEALHLAVLGQQTTWPNPMVGALVVRDNTIVGRGYHQYPGGPHAEIYALEEAGPLAKGATLYVTLEPCSHHGRTPPCVDRVIQSGIARVVIGTIDPNPLVSGEGLRRLKEAGIPYTLGICKEECLRLNEVFFHNLRTHRPFVTAKMAMSLDGRIATKSGHSQWITNEKARMWGHTLRKNHAAMLVGIGTLLADDPQLNCRIKTQRQPHVIILDSHGRTPITARVLQIPDRKVYIAVADTCPAERIHALQNAGATIWRIPIHIKGLSISAILSQAYKSGIGSILVEGGSEVLGSFLDARCIDAIWCFVGNMLIGGTDAISCIGGNGANTLEQALYLDFIETKVIDNNIFIRAIPIPERSQ